MKPIAHIESPCREKFGIPRQSGLAPSLTVRLVFEEEFRHAEAVRGLEGFSHVWLIWGFHLNAGKAWHPTVRPPRLGGNERIGVFATRSPFRPNPIGLSVAVLKSVDLDAPDSPVLILEGADLANGTPVYDIKPYIPYADAYPDARAGFVDERPRALLTVCPSAGMIWPAVCDETWRQTLEELLAQDPRPAYQNDPERIYRLSLSPAEVAFRVKDGVAQILSVTV